MIAAVLILGGLVLWLGHSWWWPARPCRRCGGSKAGVGSGKRFSNRCHWCGGTGLNTRVGALLISKITGRHPRHLR